MKKMEIGNRVLVLDEDIFGIVKEINGKFVVIEILDGFEIIYN